MTSVKCPMCNNRKKYLGLNNGYSLTCSKKCSDKLKKQNTLVNRRKIYCIECKRYIKTVNASQYEKNRNSFCRSCSAIKMRKNLKNDKKKNELFKNKVKQNQTDIWKNRTEDELKKIYDKMGTSVRDAISKMTEGERKEKYGHVNKLSPTERKKFIDNMLATGAHVWWKNASEEEKKAVYEKRRRTRYLNNGIDIDTVDILSEYKLYKLEVKRLTEKMYRKYKNVINPDKYKRGMISLESVTYQLDHIYSICRGFANNIDPKIISHVVNLQMLPSIENSIKNCKCGMSKERLFKLYEEKKGIWI